MWNEKFILLQTDLEVDGMISLAIVCARKSGSDLEETENGMTRDKIFQFPKCQELCNCTAN